VRDPAASAAADLERVLDLDGNVVGDVPAGLTDEDLVSMYRLMIDTRVFDRRATAAQRQGRLGTFAIAEGHEAIQVGSAIALRPGDYVYPGYREHGVQLARNVPMEVVLAYWRGLPNWLWDQKALQQMILTVPIATHLPHSVGHAYAARLRGEDVVTAAYIGDGGTSENDFHNGLNFAGAWRTPTVFIASNNFYAISVPYELQTGAETIAQKASGYGMPGVRVDGMDPLAVYRATRTAVERAAEDGGPTLIEAICYRYGPHATADDPHLYRTEEEEELWRPYDPMVRMRRFLEGRGLWDESREEGAFQEAADNFDAALANVEELEVPPRDDIVRHAYERIPTLLVDQLHRIQEAAGEKRTEFTPDELWPGGDGDSVGREPTESWFMADAINAALHEAMEADESMVVMGEDVGVAGGVFRITAGLHEKFGPNRVIDTPLSESGIVGTGVGMAVSGSRVVAEVQFDGFVYPAFDQVVSHMGRMRFRTRGHASVPMVLRFPNGAGIGAHEFHCDSPEAYFAHAPGLVVVVPSTPYDAKGLLTAAIRSNDPVLFLEPKVLYRSGKDDVPVRPYEIPLGTARIRREGTDLTIVTYGGMVPVSLQAAETVATEDGASIEVIDLRTIYPWDVETVTDSVTKTGRLLFVQEPQRTGGVGAEVVAEVAERCGYVLEAPPRRFAGTDAPWPQFHVEKHALIDASMVAHEIRRALAA
jgi:pyruvate/2-oxoglutarate/acetoin dehydrogenase E1 component/TPP-dependent pyruvate/acetoin dehydrogenase alpha subunit